MKRVLLLSSFLLTFVLSKAQVVLNEIYSQPGGSNHEFFELYNSSTEPNGQNADCFSFITYFEEGSKKGFYVIDLPNLPIDPKGFFVGAANSPFNYQTSTGKTPSFSWNNIDQASGYLKKWVQVPTNTGNLADGNPSYDEEPIIQPVTNLIAFAPVNGGSYYIFVYENGIKVNDFLGATGGNVTKAVTYINSMPALKIEMKGSCGVFNINFPSLTVSSFENVVEVDGTDNGYIRKYDGKCGSWGKSASGVTHTPGLSNGSAAGITGSLVTAELYKCGDPISGSVVEFNITNATGEALNDFPVEIQLYYDYGKIGTLDAGDVPMGVKEEIAYTDPMQYFTIQPQNQPVILVYKTNKGCFDKVVPLSSSCSSLPVSFSSFQAQRHRQAVALKWETLSEQNNRGFNVQRNTRGVWETVAFVFSGADGGNSATKLSYEFNDANNEKGISQYRIQQVDLDGKASYSVIRSVKGLEQAGTRTVVYPNPSADGKVSIVFEDQGAKAVVVSDLSGRVVRQYRNVLNNVQIEGLESGMYSIQITDPSTAVSTTEKIIIKKR